MDKRRRNELIFFAALFLFGLSFFLRYASLQLASDDVLWLMGEAPTVFDQYRVMPRLFFISLHALFGPSPAAALTMIFLFHTVNTLLIHRLGTKLLSDRIAVRVAVLVFFVNPITLRTLTWISCFSYVLGALMALTALLTAWESLGQEGNKRLFLSFAAVIAFGIGLFSTHTMLFLPFIFLLFGWLRGGTARWQSRILFGLAMACALFVNTFVYNFEQYGIEPMLLFCLDFAAAFTSSALSSGFSLILAYPLSLFGKTVNFLRISFAEPIRWGVTFAILGGGVLFYRQGRAWRQRIVLALSFVVLITPYIIRLYLTPPSVTYHITYVLSGRVYYLVFTILALILGEIAARLQCFLETRCLTWLSVVLLAAYLHAMFFVYDRTDFLGLQVIRGTSSAIISPHWNPYTGSQPFWFVLAVLLVSGLAVARFLIVKVMAGYPPFSQPRG